MSKNLIIGVLMMITGISLFFNFTENTEVQPALTSSLEEQVSTTTRNISMKDTFQLNTECLSHEDKLKSRVSLKGANSEKIDIEEIFYSPKLNSCLYVKTKNTEPGFIDKSLYDFLDDGDNSRPILQCHSVSPFAFELKESYKNMDGNLDQFNEDVEGCNTFELELQTYK